MKLRRPISLILASSVLGMTVAGCGLAPAPVMAPAGTVRAQVASQGAAQLAAGFAAAMSGDAEYRAIARGSRVVVDGPEGVQLVYDFARTPQTGMVRLTVGGAVTEVPFRQDPQEIAWTVAKVAIKMVYGGTKAYFKYKRTHTGADFNQEELVKAVVFGMLASGVGALPGGFLWKRLLPIVWEWVLKEPPITRTTFKQTYERWARDLDRIEAIIREARQLQPSL